MKNEEEEEENDSRLKEKGINKPKVGTNEMEKEK